MPGSDRHGSARRQRVAGVGCEVEQDPLEVGGGEDDPGKGRLGAEAELDVRSERPFDQLPRGEDRLLDCERLGRRARRGVRERPLLHQQAAAQLGAALGRLADLLGPLALGALGAGGDLVRADHDHRKQVVEVVGDARRPPSERLELCRRRRRPLLRLGPVREHDRRRARELAGPRGGLPGQAAGEMPVGPLPCSGCCRLLVHRPRGCPPRRTSFAAPAPVPAPGGRLIVMRR